MFCALEERRRFNQWLRCSMYADTAHRSFRREYGRQAGPTSACRSKDGVVEVGPEDQSKVAQAASSVRSQSSGRKQRKAATCLSRPPPSKSETMRYQRFAILTVFQSRETCVPQQQAVDLPSRHPVSTFIHTLGSVFALSLREISVKITVRLIHSLTHILCFKFSIS